MGEVRDRPPPDGVSRHFTVAVFVVHAGHVLLHPHAKLGLWLPPGGHIEPHELPDDAARREVLEETGLRVELLGGPGLDFAAEGAPQQLVRPAAVQVEDITPGHQHIDLVYLARPLGGPAGADAALPAVTADMVWVSPQDLPRLPVTAEITAWVHHALRAVGAG